MEGALRRPSFSVIIPTLQRRDVVAKSVEALARQTFEGGFEVIVVVDGSTDGTAEALRRLEVPFRLRVIEQSNQGVAAARNRGAETAAGDILLFLDDDMEADPDLLDRHASWQSAGADAVLGHIPLHPDSPATFLTEAIAEWSDNRPAVIAAAADLGLFDLMCGHLSVKKRVFDSLGGFDTAFTSGGSYGDEDLDFGWRLLKAGHRIEFNPAAIARQRYVVGFRQHLLQWRDAGRANVALTRKHPVLAEQLLRLNHARAPHIRFAVRPLARFPLAAGLGTALASGIATLWPNSRIARRIFFLARDVAYWAGVAEAGGIALSSRAGLRVLAYHSVSRTAGAGALADYVIDPGSFAAQLDLLVKRGFRFVCAEHAVAFLRGERALQPRAVLLTFDDGYVDLKQDVAAILEQRGIHALVFVVTGMLGRTNEWDEGVEAAPRQLMSAEDLREVEAKGIAVGSHSRTHRALEGLSAGELADEVDGSLADLEALGLNPMRLFCYPYGAVDEAAEEQLRMAGAGAAFTVCAGIAQPNSNPMRVPRIEILRDDGSGLRFLVKIVAAGRRLPTVRGAIRRMSRFRSPVAGKVRATSG